MNNKFSIKEIYCVELPARLAWTNKHNPAPPPNEKKILAFAE